MAQPVLTREQTEDTGTGDLILSPVDGARRLATANGTGSSNTFDCYIYNTSTSGDSLEWEYSNCYMSGPDTLVRDTVIESSNSNSLTNFTSGTKNVVVDVSITETVGDPGTNTKVPTESAVRSAIGSGSVSKPITKLVYDLGTISGTTDIDVSQGTQIRATLGGDTTFTFSGSPDTGNTIDFDLRLTDANSYAITWPAGTLFDGSVAPDIIGSLCEIPCQIEADGTVTVYGVIDDIG